MLTVNIGPLALSVTHVLLMVSLLLATLTGWWVGRKQGQNPERQVFRLLLLALLVARLAFVAVYFKEFEGRWWSIIDIRDGGFIAWPGLLTALLVGGWMVWRDRELRKPLGAALAVGVLSWSLASVGLNAFEQGTRLPEMALRDANGAPVQLEDFKGKPLGAALAVGVLSWSLASVGLNAFEQGTRLPEMALRDANGAPVQLEDFKGKPLVINLWATWCGPCRREMPVLAEAQADNPQTTFLFVNQGEGERLIRDFLESTGLQLDNVLLDSGGRLGQQVGSQALPTTLFYDAEGRQVGSHLGELSRASLTRALKQLNEESQP